eukprot:8413747-Pyramimonas_sp.AAC.1
MNTSHREDVAAPVLASDKKMDIEPPPGLSLDDDEKEVRFNDEVELHEFNDDDEDFLPEKRLYDI